MKRWTLEADGHLVASGNAIEQHAEPGKPPRFVVGDLATHVTPRRECTVRLTVDGSVVASGKARVERWGSAMLVNALSREFTVEAAR